MVLNGTVRQAFFHPPEQPKLLIVFIRTAVTIIFVNLPEPNTICLDTEMPSLKDTNVLNLEAWMLHTNLGHGD